MIFHLALRERLLGTPAISAIAGTRISWLDRPEGGALPAITLQVISDVRPQHLKGIETGRATRVQCDCWAATYAVAHALASACVAALARPSELEGKKFGPAQIDGPRDLSELLRSGTMVYRQSVDFTIWHVGD